MKAIRRDRLQVRFNEVRHPVLNAEDVPDPEQSYLAEACDELTGLRGRIETVLRSLEISPLSDEEARRPWPGLAVGKCTVCAGMYGGLSDPEEVTVADALFFREP